MSPKFVKIVIYVPPDHGDKIRRALAQSGCGHIGLYDHCSFTTTGVGRFRPLKNAKPYVGKPGRIEKVVEERIETICRTEKLNSTLVRIKKNHPYEEPAIDIYPLLNRRQL